MTLRLDIVPTTGNNTGVGNYLHLSDSLHTHTTYILPTIFEIYKLEKHTIPKSPEPSTDTQDPSLLWVTQKPLNNNMLLSFIPEKSENCGTHNDAFVTVLWIREISLLGFLFLQWVTVHRCHQLFVPCILHVLPD